MKVELSDRVKSALLKNKVTLGDKVRTEIRIVRLERLNVYNRNAGVALAIVGKIFETGKIETAPIIDPFFAQLAYWPCLSAAIAYMMVESEIKSLKMSQL